MLTLAAQNLFARAWFGKFIIDDCAGFDQDPTQREEVWLPPCYTWLLVHDKYVVDCVNAMATPLSYQSFIQIKEQHFSFVKVILL